MRRENAWIFAGMSVLAACDVSAITIDNDTLQGTIDSNVTAGIGIRTRNPACSSIGTPDVYGCGVDVNTNQWANGDAGDLNYKKGQLFTGYLSLTSEAMLKMPSADMKFMARGTLFYDPLAKDTQTTPLTGDADGQMVHRGRILDLWAEKDFAIGEQDAHIRVGDQVINWGESIYAMGGISASNALDIQTLLTPGTQLKQAYLPGEMISFASSLPAGFSTEAYYQFNWQGNIYPAVGSFWSTTNLFGRGAQAALINPNNFNVGYFDPTVSYPFPYSTVNPDTHPQYGLRLGYKPPGEKINFALYFENYTDKSPVVESVAGGSAGEFSYLPNRKMIGLSTNFPLGMWAIGSELSYRPHDAVAMSGCYGAGGPLDVNTNGAPGNCQSWMDNKKYQFTTNALLAMTPSTHPMLNALGADEAVFTAEVSVIDYPGIAAGKQYMNPANGAGEYQVPDAGYSSWLNNNSGLGYPIAAGQGTAKSAGYTMDFNWTYDGTVIPSWQVTPGMTFTNAFSGYTPTLTANYARGAKSINFYTLFMQNPAIWQAGINYSLYFGGNALSQPYADRNFIGAFVTRNF